MTLATALTRAQFGLDAPLVRVEVHCGDGLPQFTVVGLAETAVRESRERVRAALAHCGAEFPAGRVTVNLAPADLPKEGGRFDLAVALGILAASGQIPAGRLDDIEFYGELSLSGELRPVRGLLAAAVHAVRDRRCLAVPGQNADEARVARGARVAAVSSLTGVCNGLRGGKGLEFTAGGELPVCEASGPDLADVRGQAGARRALEIAAAGSHSLLLIGPPGAGKSMLAQRLPGLLPPLDDAEALECAMLHSLSRALPPVAEWRRRPFRSPHHGASAAAVIGGGGRLRPGEISLAHHGVLFLDELPEYRRDVLEALREPLETGSVSIARAAWHGQFPARFQLVAAMNPCQCGYAGDANSRCRCTAPLIRRYRARISGPLLDRIDLHVEVARLEYASLSSAVAAPESSASVAARVREARSRQLQRGALNSTLDPGISRQGLRTRASRARIARHGIPPTRAFGARLPPDPPRCAHDRRSRGVCDRRYSGALGGDRIPAARSRAAGGNRLAACCHQVFDRRLDGVVGEVKPSALRRHETGGSLEALDCVQLERLRSLRDTRRPGRPVADLRGPRQAGAVAGDARRFVYRLAVGFIDRPGRAASGRRHGRHRGRGDGERRIVLARDRDPPERRDSLVGRRLHEGIVRVAGALRAAVHEARNADEDERDRDQHAQHGAENVEEMPVRFRHARIIASGPRRR